MILRYLAVTAALAISLWGCGKANDGAPSLDVSGQHPAGWVLKHGPSYLENSGQCRECHGADLTGGISKVSCFSVNLGAQTCHSGGPHPVPWPEHNKAPNQGNACTPCHGANLGGGAIAPACATCHTQLIPGTVPVLGTCITCHNKPPQGGIFPNISGAHRKHNLLPGVGGVCDTCHNGGGTGKANHGRQLTVAFLPAYNAKTGTATLNSDNSCSNVRCHGGVRTPPWRTGRIDTGSNCVACHTLGTAFQTPQFNSYYSGEHAFHTAPPPTGEVGLVCGDCHDMTVTRNGAAHFGNLSSARFDLDPGFTIRAPVGYTKNGATITCSPGQLPPPGSFSIGVCHGQRSW